MMAAIQKILPWITFGVRADRNAYDIPIPVSAPVTGAAWTFTKYGTLVANYPTGHPNPIIPGVLQRWPHSQAVGIPGGSNLALINKGSTRAGSTGNLTLSGTQTVDGVALGVGDEVLAKNQTNKAQNGVYVVASGAWTRRSDMDAVGEMNAGSTVAVRDGTVNKFTLWTQYTTGTVTPGTTLTDWYCSGGEYVFMLPYEAHISFIHMCSAFRDVSSPTSASSQQTATDEMYVNGVLKDTSSMMFPGTTTTRGGNQERFTLTARCEVENYAANTWIGITDYIRTGGGIPWVATYDSVLIAKVWPLLYNWKTGASYSVPGNII